MPVNEHIFGGYNTTKLYNKTEFNKRGEGIKRMHKTGFKREQLIKLKTPK